ncbi:transketolase family protein [Candidatus Azambacteria bacterium]|nr:transketolase family protein [Candidatus Azambacteria bacterium]
MINEKMHLVEDLFGEGLKAVPTRNGFGEGLVNAGKKNKNVVALCADLTDSTRISYFQKEFPARYFEVGVAEQNMAGIAAGMAVAGKVPFISSYGVFSPGRNWDQIRVSICYNNANVKIAGAHTGISVGPDGATHQALEDMAITRCLPGLVVIAPCDSIETKKATEAVAEHKGPVYMRFARENDTVFTTEETPFEIGKANLLKDGSDVAVVACGPLVYKALVAAKELEKDGISVAVLNNHTISPMDKNAVLDLAKKTNAVVTVEEHQINGGMGSAVAEILSRNYPVPVEMVGMQNSFGESGEPKELLEKYGMSVDGIKMAVKKVLERKK